LVERGYRSSLKIPVPRSLQENCYSTPQLPRDQSYFTKYRVYVMEQCPGFLQALRARGDDKKSEKSGPKLRAQVISVHGHLKARRGLFNLLPVGNMPDVPH